MSPVKDLMRAIDRTKEKKRRRAERQVEDALEILLYLGLVEYDEETDRYRATDKAVGLDDDQLEEMLQKALDPRSPDKTVRPCPVSCGARRGSF